MSDSMSFFSKCPKCGYARLQDGYTRVVLVGALDTGLTIEAYCLQCDVVWPISVQERSLLARGIAAEQQETSSRSPHDSPASRRPGDRMERMALDEIGSNNAGVENSSPTGDGAPGGCGTFACLAGLNWARRCQMQRAPRGFSK